MRRKTHLCAMMDAVKRKWWRRFRYLLLGYALLCALFFAYQHLLYFQPRALTANHVFTFPVQLRFTHATIPFDANTQVDVVKFLPEDSTKPSRGVVLFFHGNRYNVEHYSTYAPYFTRHGYEVWMPDYPGYGRSRGEINMDVLDELALQLHTMARSRFASEEIIVYGKSLGTGIAAYLAAQRDCGQLLLETPYYSLSSLTQAYAFFLPIPNIIRFNLEAGKHFAEVQAPITILHGTHDELIPMGNVLRLLPAMKPTDALYLVQGATHNTLPDYPRYHAVLDSVLAR